MKFKYHCPNCELDSLTSEWLHETDIDCQLCGHHPGKKCPNCGEIFDFLDLAMTSATE